MTENKARTKLILNKQLLKRPIPTSTTKRSVSGVDTQIENSHLSSVDTIQDTSSALQAKGDSIVKQIDNSNANIAIVAQHNTPEYQTLNSHKKSDSYDKELDQNKNPATSDPSGLHKDTSGTSYESKIQALNQLSPNINNFKLPSPKPSQPDSVENKALDLDNNNPTNKTDLQASYVTKESPQQENLAKFDTAEKSQPSITKESVAEAPNSNAHLKNPNKSHTYHNKSVPSNNPNRKLHTNTNLPSNNAAASNQPKLNTLSKRATALENLQKTFEANLVSLSTINAKNTASTTPTISTQDTTSQDAQNTNSIDANLSRTHELDRSQRGSEHYNSQSFTGSRTHHPSQFKNTTNGLRHYPTYKTYGQDQSTSQANPHHRSIGSRPYPDNFNKETSSRFSSTPPKPSISDRSAKLDLLQSNTLYMRNVVIDHPKPVAPIAAPPTRNADDNAPRLYKRYTTPQSDERSNHNFRKTYPRYEDRPPHNGFRQPRPNLNTPFTSQSSSGPNRPNVHSGYNKSPYGNFPDSRPNYNTHRSAPSTAGLRNDNTKYPSRTNEPNAHNFGPSALHNFDSGQSKWSQHNKKGNKSKYKYEEDDQYIRSKRDTRGRFSMYGNDDDGFGNLTRRNRKKAKKSTYASSHVPMELQIGATIPISELANLINQKPANLVSELSKYGFEYHEYDIIDYESAKLALEDMGHTVQRMDIYTVEAQLKKAADIAPNNDTNSEGEAGRNFISKPPVVVIMGHVDHGKTSLLDALRQSSITKNEHGGITQHIGAYSIEHKDSRITFLDTPGHEAFSQIRSRGSNVADIAILVVAADDGIKPQTIEAITHIRSAKIPMIVAVNKIDKTPNYDKISNDLLQHNIVPESMGGDVMVVPISALKGTNLDQLCESILILAEMSNIRYAANLPCSGVIIEAKIDKSQGISASILVQAGSLKRGDVIASNGSWGKVKLMYDDLGQKINSVGAAMPAEIFGLSTLPQVGSKFMVVSSEKEARHLSENFDNTNISTSEEYYKAALSKLQAPKNFKTLNLIVKTDTSSSLEAIKASLTKLSNEELEIKVIHGGLSPITEADIVLAQSSNGMIVTFNLKSPANIQKTLERQNIKVLSHYVIYSLIDEVKQIASGMLDPLVTEVELGTAEIKEVFILSKYGTVAGCQVIKGKVKRNAKARIIRNNVVMTLTKIESIRRFKEDVAEALEGFECGISLKDCKDFKAGDLIECYEEVKTPKTL